MLAKVHDKVAGLLGGPGPVGMCGYAQDMQVAVADLEHEQHVEAPQRDRAVDVEEVDRQHAGGPVGRSDTVAELGQGRFHRPQQLASWAGSGTSDVGRGGRICRARCGRAVL